MGRVRGESLVVLTGVREEDDQLAILADLIETYGVVVEVAVFRTVLFHDRALF
jgi:hypothetical protein